MKETIEINAMERTIPTALLTLSLDLRDDEIFKLHQTDHFLGRFYEEQQTDL